MLRTIFEKHSNAHLIEIIELEDAYTEEAKQVALELLNERHVLPSSQKTMAMDFWREKIKDEFRTLIKKKPEFSSAYLNDEEFKVLFEEAYDYHMERQELFEIDITKYWAAIL